MPRALKCDTIADAWHTCWNNVERWSDEASEKECSVKHWLTIEQMWKNMCMHITQTHNWMRTIKNKLSEYLIPCVHTAQVIISMWNYMGTGCRTKGHIHVFIRPFIFKHIRTNLTSHANVHLMWNKAEINFTAALIEKYKIHMFHMNDKSLPDWWKCKEYDREKKSSSVLYTVRGMNACRIDSNDVDQSVEHFRDGGQRTAEGWISEQFLVCVSLCNPKCRSWCKRSNV